MDFSGPTKPFYQKIQSPPVRSESTRTTMLSASMFSQQARRDSTESSLQPGHGTNNTIRYESEPAATSTDLRTDPIALQQYQHQHDSQSRTSTKMRPAKDVMHRIQWDGSYCVEKFVVGYEDRHEGIMELDLSLWKSESSDEEFIPMHRIRYFRNTVTDDIVWHRNLRIDKIFNSA